MPTHRPLLTRPARGPADEATTSVVVSVTEFSVDRVRDLPGVVATGLRLRLGWYAMPGAVALWLWSLPLSSRGGSISVWTSEDDLRRFVALPHHVDVMRRYRDRGTVRATTWITERFAAGEILARARRWVAEPPR